MSSKLGIYLRILLVYKHYKLMIIQLIMVNGHLLVEKYPSEEMCV